MLGASDAGSMSVTGATTVEEARPLILQFASDFKPAVGTVLTLLKAGSFSGNFCVTGLMGYEFEAIFSATGLQLRVKTAPKA